MGQDLLDKQCLDFHNNNGLNFMFLCAFELPSKRTMIILVITMFFFILLREAAKKVLS